MMRQETVYSHSYSLKGVVITGLEQELIKDLSKGTEQL